MPDIKKIKRAILETVGGSTPPEKFVNQHDILDSMLAMYFNKVTPMPEEGTLTAICAAGAMAKRGAKHLTPPEMKALIEKNSL